MGFTQFPKKQLVRRISSSGIEEKIGSVQVQKDIQLKISVLRLIVNGVPVGNERFRINFYSSELYNTKLFSSSWFDLSTAIDETLDYWYGRVRLYFSGEFLDSDILYYATIETENYTKTPAYYLGFAIDSPISQNTSTVQSNKAIYMALFGVAA